MADKKWCIAFFWSCFVLLSGYDSSASEIYFIDAHSQLDHNLGKFERIIQRMDTGGVYCTILAARSGRKPNEVAAFAETHPNRIVPAVRTKSGAYNKNAQKYYKKLYRQVDSGRFKAMAEVLMYHARKGSKAPEVIVFPDDKRVQAALNAAVKNAWPFVIHIEFGSLGKEERKVFMAGMEMLLNDHPRHPFVLNHMGQLKSAAVRRLIEKHRNIYFLTAHTTPVIIRNSNEPWINMFQGETLSPAWKGLLLKYPDRFVFALDNVWKKHWEDYYLDQMEYWRKAMADLPLNVAHLIAHGNAERLWKIPPRPAQ